MNLMNLHSTYFLSATLKVSLLIAGSFLLVLGNVGMAQRGDDSTIDLQMAELSYKGYQDSKEKRESEQAMEYLKMAIEYFPKGESLDARRAKWSKELIG